MEENEEEIRKKFYKTLQWYFSEKSTPTGVYSTIGTVKDELIKLNANLENANASSGKLTKALNRITLVGVIIAGLGVLTAVASLVFTLIKYFANGT
jgi:hypothetical protein